MPRKGWAPSLLQAYVNLRFDLVYDFGLICFVGFDSESHIWFGFIYVFW
jgi:hypothetical protein